MPVFSFYHAEDKVQDLHTDLLNLLQASLKTQIMDTFLSHAVYSGSDSQLV